MDHRLKLRVAEALGHPGIPDRVPADLVEEFDKIGLTYSKMGKPDVNFDHAPILLVLVQYVHELRRQIEELRAAHVPVVTRETTGIEPRQRGRSREVVSVG